LSEAVTVKPFPPTPRTEAQQQCLSPLVPKDTATSGWLNRPSNCNNGPLVVKGAYKVLAALKNSGEL
jgi:hypothetical protein